MQNNVKGFEDYLNEASLRGNIGIPGEEGSGRESWLDKITRRSNAAAREFAMRSRDDIQNFGNLIERSVRLQSGHEEELSQLTVEAFRELYGYLLEEIELDLKVSTREEVKGSMEETPDKPEMPELEELEDQGLINQVHKRKILRTIQQGKGLSAKSILNLSIFKNGLTQIMGQEAAAEYLTVLNKIANVAQFFDWEMPEELQKQMWQARQGFSGSCDIEFDEEETKEKEDIAQKVLDDLANGEDITDSPDAEELVDGLNVRIVARGIDLSVLIHESIKGIYKLITQAALESLYGGDAEKVLMNTDTLFDELQEIKFGRQMQDAFFKQVSEHPIVARKINDMISQDASDIEISAFQEKLNYLFFNEIAQLGKEDAKEMLDVVNEILSESPAAAEMCDPLIRKALKDLQQEEEYQSWKGEETPMMEPEEEPEMELPRAQEEPKIPMGEIEDAIIDAYQRGDMAEVARLRAMLGESNQFYHLFGRLL